VRGEPIQYITGECEFYGLPIRVTSDVLIPRPETEHLVETALQFATGWEHPRILDVGTGSGAIAVALAKMMPSARITAVDVSVAALKIACENARQNNIADRIEFRQSDLLAAVEAPFELIVSNPPYVSTTDGANLSVEVREYEPAQALFAGDDGLAIYRRLIPAAFAALVPGGSLLMEIGYDQSEQVAALLTEAGLQGVMFVADLQGIARVACAQRPRS
jgi:release factor glutamine methyltransferase